MHLLLWDDERHDWLLPTPAGSTGPISGAGLTGGTCHEHELPTSLLRYAQRTGEPLVVDDATRDDRFARDPYFTDLDCCSLLAVPILSRGTLRAMLLLENRLLRGAFTTERLDAVTVIAGQLAVSLALRLRAAQAALPPESGELTAQLDSLVGEATATLDELRELARGIHPAVLAEGGLAPALEALARRSTVPTQLQCRIQGRLPEQIEIAAYYGVSEALTNTTKHAAASMVHIQLDTVDGDDYDVLQVEIRDDGRGGADSARGTGLLGLHDRVEALGGRILLHSPPDAGTTLRLELPLTDANTGGTFR